MKKLIAAGLLAAAALAGAGTAQAQTPAERYQGILHVQGINRTADEAMEVGNNVCVSRTKGYSGASIVTSAQKGLDGKPISWSAAVNVVGYAESIFCPEYWDMA